MNPKTPFDIPIEPQKDTSFRIPGPGTYTYLESSFDANHHFTMTRADRFAADPDSPLGPGRYSPRTTQKIIGGAVGKSFRPVVTASESPGPGRYESHVPNNGPFFSLGNRDTLNKRAPKSPGPGDYDIPVSKQTKIYSLSLIHI